MTSYRVQRVFADQTRPLRHQVLRPGQLLETVVFPGDDVPATAHFVAMDQTGAVVSTGSIYCECQPGRAEANGWRLRGMATSSHLLGKNLGTMVLEACIAYAACEGAGEIWCNARTSATGFYEKFGFVKDGIEFEIDGIGPHFVMRKSL
jgi:predicted GNAT family N-acyltransferase